MTDGWAGAWRWHVPVGDVRDAGAMVERLARFAPVVDAADDEQDSSYWQGRFENDDDEEFVDTLADFYSWANDRGVRAAETLAQHVEAAEAANRAGQPRNVIRRTT